MNPWHIIARYTMGHVINGVVMVTAVVSGVVILIDMLELLRRTYAKTVPFWVTIKILLFKFPHLLLETMPFIVLLGSMIAFARLASRSEWIICRLSGIPSWRVLMPSVMMVFLFGIFLICVIHPLAATMLNASTVLEHKHIQRKELHTSALPTGIWIKEEGEHHYRIIRASSLESDKNRFHNVAILLFNHENNFIKRLNATYGELEHGELHLVNVTETNKKDFIKHYDHFVLPTNMDIDTIRESYAPPKTISFWEFPRMINILEITGFSALKHRMHWYTLMVQPLFMAALVVIGAFFAVHHPRRTRKAWLHVIGIVCGFGIYFLSKLMMAFGLSGLLPLWLAATAMTCITILLSLAAMFHMEEVS